MKLKTIFVNLIDGSGNNFGSIEVEVTRKNKMYPMGKVYVYSQIAERPDGITRKNKGEKDA